MKKAWVIVLEDRHVEVQVRVFADHAQAVEAYEDIIESYCYDPPDGEEDVPVPEWDRHATLSGEDDHIRLQEVEVE